MKCAACWLIAAVVLAATADARPRRVLFLGNSLTYCNDLPALVQAMAAAAGHELECVARASPDYALEDHWGGGTRSVLQRGRFDVVVMQQGPSTRPESRTHLAHWTRKWAEFARAAGAEPALYMVWPHATQRSGFLLVSESYRGAARAAAMRIFPAGEAWALALHANPRLPLHEPDALHPTPAGSYLAALVIARGLTGLDPALVPAKLMVRGTALGVPEEHAEVFRTIVRELRYDDDAAPASAVTPASR